MFSFTADEGGIHGSHKSISAVADVPSSSPAEQPELNKNRKMHRIAVTGAAGFVGSHVCRELTEAGWKVRALVRSTGKAASRIGHLPLELKVGDLQNPEYLESALEGVDVVVHLAAIAIEKGGQTYEKINTQVTLDLIQAAQRTGVTRFIHMSQNGSDSKSPYRFLRSKGLAQDAVAESSLRWTILRPSVIFGPEDEFVNVLAKMVRLSPVLFPLPGGGKARFQPISVRDVAKAVRVALDRDETIGGIYGIGGPAILTLRQMTDRILAAMQVKRGIFGIPVPVMKPLLGVMEHIIPHPPVTKSLLDLLKVDNVVKDNAITTVFGIDPIPFAQEELLYLKSITASRALKSLFGDGG